MGRALEEIEAGTVISDPNLKKNANVYALNVKNANANVNKNKKLENRLRDEKIN